MKTNRKSKRGRLIFNGALFGNEFVLYNNFPLDILQDRMAELISNGEYKQDDLTIVGLRKKRKI